MPTAPFVGRGRCRRLLAALSLGRRDGVVPVLLQAVAWQRGAATGLTGRSSANRFMSCPVLPPVPPSACRSR